MNNKTTEDLALSDLTLKDIRGRDVAMPENNALDVIGNAQGYVIPYFNMQGKPIPFFRVKYFGQSYKYKQPAKVGNHIYYPPAFWNLLLQKTFNSKEDEIINIVVCEGEKKAACAVKKGILAIGLGGVDSWRNRIIQLPKNVEMSSNKNASGDKAYSLRIKPGTDLEESINGGILAKGLKELFDTSIQKNWHLTIIFDTDNQELGMKTEVQRAAAVLGFEMVQMGLKFNQVHQIILPYDSDGEDAEITKVGLDDYLLSEEHVTNIQRQLHLLTTPKGGLGTFPKHPNIKEYTSRILTRSNLPRDSYRKLATAILADMESRGKRIRSLASGEMFYFDRTTRKLIEVEFIQQQKNSLHSTEFGRWIYLEYGLTGNDHKILSVLHALFESVEPIENIDPHKLISRPKVGEDIIRYQINDGQYVKVSASVDDPIEIVDNGVDGVLFESGHTEPLDAKILIKEFNKQLKASKGKKVSWWWHDVVNNTRMKSDPDARKLAALLYYISPWLNKWRGTQIPVEVVLGEAGSGKSSMYEHRLNILTGRANLRNSPTDLRDWHASVTSSGGLHVTDNVVFSDKQLRQRLSDELCRLVTEPDPHVEMRKLYTNNKLIRLPITTTFAITAIQQPFLSADILQRSVIIEMDKASAVGAHGKMVYDSFWVPNQMIKYGGREAWVAHHLLVLHKFFQIVFRKWNDRYPAGYRLINLEQTLVFMCEVFDDDSTWIPKYLAGSTRKQVAAGDWVLEGLTTYARTLYKNAPHALVTAGNIVEWALSSEDYADCTPMQNSRRLGRYIKTNQQLVREVCGVCSIGKRQNVETYKIEPRDSWKILEEN